MEPLTDEKASEILNNADSYVISDEIKDSLNNATDVDLEPEELPYSEPEPDIINNEIEHEPGSNPDLMSMDFIPADLVMTVLSIFIPLIAIAIYQKVYGKKAIDKKVVKKEYSFTMKEERQVEEKLELWLKSLQVKAPSPFLQLVIVLLVIMGGKAVNAHGEIVESIEDRQEEEKLLQQLEEEKKKNKIIALTQKVEVEKNKTISLSTELPKRKGRPPGSTKKTKKEVKQEIEYPQDEEPKDQDDLIQE